MSEIYATEQEEFWAGEFGYNYLERNALDQNVIAHRMCIWSKVLQRAARPSSILELGCNVGQNLHALHNILPNCSLSGVEINHTAAEIVRAWGGADIIEKSILEFCPQQKWDMVFTSGVLIHINPDELGRVYSLMDNASNQYVCMLEYYNTTPMTISYHGCDDRLFKRDFCGDFLDMFPKYRLADYGFIYHRDMLAPAGDLTWFLLEKL